MRAGSIALSSVGAAAVLVLMPLAPHSPAAARGADAPPAPAAPESGGAPRAGAASCAQMTAPAVRAALLPTAVRRPSRPDGLRPPAAVRPGPESWPGALRAAAMCGGRAGRAVLLPPVASPFADPSGRSAQRPEARRAHHSAAHRTPAAPVPPPAERAPGGAVAVAAPVAAVDPEDAGPSRTQAVVGLVLAAVAAVVFAVRSVRRRRSDSD
ncbi:hypothetical protein [Streptomyces sp. NPDC090026]|uniref:hypothetical protein n=1 Tax=Streptomyces sp. NPDC090026 TaxID=3365923 RepID=UPI0038049169